MNGTQENASENKTINPNVRTAGRTFTFQDFIDGPVAVIFENQEQLDTFLKVCDNRDLCWCNGDTASNTPHEMDRTPVNNCSIVYKFGGMSGLGFGNINDGAADAFKWYKVPFTQLVVEP